jgi:hypothetical protein
LRQQPGSVLPEGRLPASDSERAALIERVKTLAGTWEASGPDGTHVASVFTVSSNGSVVREIMLPGTAHEMTNMYTMDGPTLVMTHYCAMGNQPHMRAHASSDPKVIKFEPDGVSDLKNAEQGYMGAMTLTLVDADHLKTRLAAHAGRQAAGRADDLQPDAQEVAPRGARSPNRSPSRSSAVNRGSPRPAPASDRLVHGLGRHSSFKSGPAGCALARRG